MSGGILGPYFEEHEDELLAKEFEDAEGAEMEALLRHVAIHYWIPENPETVH